MGHTLRAYLPDIPSCVQLFGFQCLVACRLLCPWDLPGKPTVVGCHFLLQGLFPTQRSNRHLLHWQALTGGFFTPEPPLLYMHCANSPGMVRLEGCSQFKKWTSHSAIGTRSTWVVNEKQVWNLWRQELACKMDSNIRHAKKQWRNQFSSTPCHSRSSPLSIVYSAMQYIHNYKHIRHYFFFFMKMAY